MPDNSLPKSRPRTFEIMTTGEDMRTPRRNGEDGAQKQESPLFSFIDAAAKTSHIDDQKRDQYGGVRS